MYNFTIKRKSIKKGWKILIILSVLLVFLGTALYLISQSSTVQTYFTRKLANKLSGQLNTKIHIGGIDIAFFNKVILKNFWAEDNFEDTLVFVERFAATIDSFSFREKYIAFKNIGFENSSLRLSSDSSGNFSYRLPEIKQDTSKKEAGKWKVICSDFSFKGANIFYTPAPSGGNQNVLLNDINFNIKNLKFLGDSLSFDMNSLSLHTSNDFDILNMGASISVGKGITRLRNVSLNTLRSEIAEAGLSYRFHGKAGLDAPAEILLNIGRSQISFEDLAIFIPAIEGMDQVVDFSGEISGSMASLRGRDIYLRTGRNTVVNCNFYLNGLPDIENLYLFFDLDNLQTSFSDLNNINLPEKSGIRKLTFPEPFYQAGQIRYRGNFTGFLTDFVAYGKMESRMGNISTDLSFVPLADRKLQLDGKLSTTDFKLGSLFKNPGFGNISFDGQVNGEYDRANGHIGGTFIGGISNFDIKGYTYENIVIDGTFEDKNFDGMIRIDDPNLTLDFLGKLHLNPDIPEFDFDLSLRKTDLIALNLDSTNTTSGLAMIVKANFKGDNIDNLNGFINIENGSYRNQNGELTFQDMNVKTGGNDTNRILTFNSGFFDAEIIGRYNLRKLPDAFRNIISVYLPGLKVSENKFVYRNNFVFNAQIKDLDKITEIFLPGTTVETPFSVGGEINTDSRLFALNSNLPGIVSGNYAFKDILLRAESNDSYSAKIGIGHIQTKSDFDIYNISLNTEAKSNCINTRLTWNNYHRLTYSGEIDTRTELSGAGPDLSARIEIFPSKIYLADSLWNINHSSISIDSSAITVNNLTFTDKTQAVKIDGKITENFKDRLTVTLKDIRLGQIENYLQQDRVLKGTINGDIEVEDFYGKRLIYSDLSVSGLHYKGQDLGNVYLVNRWDNATSKITTELEIKKEGQPQLEVFGDYEPQNRSLQYTARFDHLPVIILDQFIRKSLSGFKGEATGQLKIYGTPENIFVDGALMGDSAGLEIDYTKVNYRFSDSVKFKRDRIIFDNITIYDELNNQGTFNGTIRHKNFRDMEYNLSISSPKILAINTTPKDNGLFYGKVIAGGSFYVTGVGTNIDLNGDGKALLGSEVNISLDYEQEAAQYDFIRFVDKSFREEEATVFTNTADTSTNLNLRIEVTPEAKAQLIYNSQIGDIIKVQGDGILQLGMDKNGDITIFGTCNITRGDYLFTLQNIINKKFTIEPGGSITWSGDPYNAIINLAAVYSLRASLYQLFLNNYQNIDNTQRIPVDCKINLTGNLTNPDIGFDIAFPMVETRLVDELQQFFNTEEEMNRQIISLVVLGQFYTPEYMRGSYDASITSPNLIGSTASELFSNQFSNWLSQISNDFDIGLNYRPGSQVTKDEVELALSTQIFNDRVTLNGNIGNNANPTGNNNSQIVGDFDLKVKLTNNGKIQLKAFNRSNNNLIYETAPYTQGIGLIFKEEYDTFEELLDNLLSLISLKK